MSLPLGRALLITPFLTGRVTSHPCGCTCSISPAAVSSAPQSAISSVAPRTFIWSSCHFQRLCFSLFAALPSCMANSSSHYQFCKMLQEFITERPGGDTTTRFVVCAGPDSRLAGTDQGQALKRVRGHGHHARLALAQDLRVASSCKVCASCPLVTGSDPCCCHLCCLTKLTPAPPFLFHCYPRNLSEL